MISRNAKRLFGLIALVLTTLCAPVTVASAIPTGSHPMNSPLRDCVSERGSLSVLFLIDESSSLKKSDPGNLRVAALQAAISALSLNAGWATAKGEQYEIEVALAGFGTKYAEPRRWFTLSDASDNELSKAVAEFETRNTSDYTDYETALSGAIETFDEREHSSLESCRVLVWLSDGKLDVDGVNGTKTKEAAENLCEPDGLADRVRDEGIYLVGFGLSTEITKTTDFDLMEGISTGSNTCGANAGYGQFRLVEGADGLIAELFSDLSPYPPQVETGRPCIGEESNSECFEFVFRTRPPLSRLKMLVSALAGVDSAEVVAPSLDSTTFLQGGKAIEVNGESVDSAPLYERVAIVSLSFPSGMRLHGEWVIRFRGPKASEATVSALFFSDVSAKVTGGEPISVNRENPQPIVVEVSEFGTEGLSEQSSVGQIAAFDEEPTIAATVVFGETKIPATVKSLSASQGTFEVMLTKDQLNGQPALGTLWIEPRALLGGHEIRFSRSVFSFKVRAGEGMPDIVSVTASKIDGKGSSTVVITIEGPTDGQGSARITDDFKVISRPSRASGEEVTISPNGDTRQILSGEVVELEVQVRPAFEANGILKVELKLELVGDSGSSQEVPVVVEIEMDREACWICGLVRAIVMFLVFVGVQMALILIGSRRLARLRPLPSYTKVTTGTLEVKPDGSIRFDGGPPAEIGKKWVHLGNELGASTAYVVGGVTFRMFVGDTIKSLFRPVRTYIHAKRNPGDPSEIAVGDCGFVVRGAEAWALCRTSLQDSWVFVVDRATAKDALETERPLVGLITYVFGDQTDEPSILGAEAETVLTQVVLRDRVASLLSKFSSEVQVPTIGEDLSETTPPESRQRGEY